MIVRISDRLYDAIWNKLSPEDFDTSNATDRYLLEFLGWDEYDDEIKKVLSK